MEILDELEDIGAEINDTLERFMEDEELYLKYVGDFPNEPTMGQLTQAVNEKDYETAEKKVHALKGIVNNLGFLPLADATIDMLEEFRAKNVEDALEAYKDVKKQYEIFCDVINAWKQNTCH